MPTIEICPLVLTSIVFKVFSGLLGLVFAGGALSFVSYRSAFRWRRLANAYASVDLPSKAIRRMETCILRGGERWLAGVRAYQSYLGIVTITVDEFGMGLRLMMPFQLFHPPLFIPHEEISVRPVRWFLNDNTCGLTTLQVPEIDLLVSESVVRWMAEVSGKTMELEIDNPLGAQRIP